MTLESGIAGIIVNNILGGDTTGIFDVGSFVFSCPGIAGVVTITESTFLPHSDPTHPSFGVATPKTEGLVIANSVFLNFNESNMRAIRTCWE